MRLNSKETIKEAYEKANAGQTIEAIELCDEVLQDEPGQREALFLKGRILSKQQKLEEAAKSFNLILESEPNDAATLHQIGNLHLKSKALELAASFFRKALKFHPVFSPAMIGLSRISISNEDWTEAEKQLRNAVKFNPNALPAWNLLGGVMQKKGNLDSALSAYKKIVKINPGNVEAWFNCGLVFQAKENHTRAVEYFEKAMHVDPSFAPALQAASELSVKLGNKNQAKEYITRLETRSYENADQPFVVGRMLHGLGETASSFKVLQKAIHLDEKHAGSLYYLGMLAQTANRFEEAISYYEQSIESEEEAVTHYALGTANQYLRHFEKAKLNFERCKQLDDEHKGADLQVARVDADLCDWSNRAKEEDRYIEVLTAIIEEDKGHVELPLLDLNYFNIPSDLHLQALRYYANSISKQVASQQIGVGSESGSTKNKIRIGYLSPDFCEHAVGRLIQDLFAHHDEERFEVFAYSLVNLPADVIQQKIRLSVDHFVDVSNMHYLSAANKISSDAIDILIDLGGYTTHAQPRIAALRPAKIQMQYLGNPDTMEATFIDYIIADKNIVSNELAQSSDMKFLHLNSTFIGSKQPNIQLKTRSDAGLPSGGFVYGCFNLQTKINPETFDAWCEILKSTEESYLWLFSNNAPAKTNLINEASLRGISSNRLIFRKQSSYDFYLADLQLLDAFLDTFGYSAGSTAIDVLSCGVPMVSMPGSTYASRMGYSILCSIGLKSLTANSTKEYIELALRIRNDKTWRLQIVQQIQVQCETEQGCFDVSGFVRALESEIYGLLNKIG